MERDLDIRRPELQGVRRTGTVRWFTDEKGYGRITADDGEVLWFHHTSVEMDGYPVLEGGTACVVLLSTSSLARDQLEHNHGRRDAPLLVARSAEAQPALLILA